MHTELHSGLHYNPIFNLPNIHVTHVFPVSDTFSPKEGFSISSQVTADEESKLILCAKVSKCGRKCLAQGQAFRFMVGPDQCHMISKYGASLSKAVGPVDPSVLVVKICHFNKKIFI